MWGGVSLQKFTAVASAMDMAPMPFMLCRSEEAWASTAYVPAIAAYLNFRFYHAEISDDLLAFFSNLPRTPFFFNLVVILSNLLLNIIDSLE